MQAIVVLRRRFVAAALFALSASVAQEPAWAAAPAGPVTTITILDVVPDYAMPHNVAESSALLEGLADATRGTPGVDSFR